MPSHHGRDVGRKAGRVLQCGIMAPAR
jgi:hypothetical protein